MKHLLFILFIRHDNKGNATQIISTTTNTGNPQITTIATKKYGYSCL